MAEFDTSRRLTTSYLSTIVGIALPYTEFELYDVKKYRDSSRTAGEPASVRSATFLLKLKLLRTVSGLWVNGSQAVAVAYE